MVHLWESAAFLDVMVSESTACAVRSYRAVIHHVDTVVFYWRCRTALILQIIIYWLFILSPVCGQDGGVFCQRALEDQ